MSLFNSSAPLYADLTLVLQVVVFVLVVGGGIIAMYRRGFNKHGVVMAIAVALHSLSIVIVMIPSSLNFGRLLSAPFSNLALIMITHIVAGTLVEFLGIWLVVNWGVHYRNIKACARKKIVMRVTIGLWLVELLLGVYVYVMLYVLV